MVRERVKSKLAGIPVVAVDYDLETQALGGILEGARELGWRLVDLRLHVQCESMGSALVGIITNKKPNEEVISRYASKGVPYVILAVKRVELPGIVNVRLDRVAIARMAAEYFVGRGIFDLGFLGSRPWGNHELLYRGLNEEARRLGCNLHLYRYSGMFGDGINTDLSPDFAHWLEQVPKPIGIVTAADRMGAALCAECLKLGWAVPRDVAILGIGNQSFYCESSLIPLSAIDPDQHERGRRAVQVIYDMQAGLKNVPSEILIPPKRLVERRTTPSPSLVADVRRFMHDNLQYGMTVMDVADEFGVSRRTIERAFREELDTSVNDELRRIRLDRCCELLTTTNLKAADIASLVGFSSKDYLQRVFKTVFGKSLMEYRREARREP